MEIALISVIITGLIALATFLLTTILNLLVDALKCRSETIAGGMKIINIATNELMAVIAEWNPFFRVFDKSNLNE